MAQLFTMRAFIRYEDGLGSFAASMLIRSCCPLIRSISLLEFLAVKLALERAWILHHDPLIEPLPLVVSSEPSSSDFISSEWFAILKVCQESYESVTYDRILASVTENSADALVNPAYQVVLCMDDRECSLRRHLEELDAGIETFGTAGHFGIECLYQHDDEAFARKHCPAPIPPMFFISEPRQPREARAGSFASSLVACNVDPLREFVDSFFFKVFAPQ